MTEERVLLMEDGEGVDPNCALERRRMFIEASRVGKIKLMLSAPSGLFERVLVIDALLMALLVFSLGMFIITVLERLSMEIRLVIYGILTLGMALFMLFARLESMGETVLYPLPHSSSSSSAATHGRVG
jgi:hypothetical protein